MVINVGWLKQGETKYKQIYEEINGVVKAVGNDITVKVILETGLLNNEEKIDACILCILAGAKFVKTSTGNYTANTAICLVIVCII